MPRSARTRTRLRRTAFAAVLTAVPLTGAGIAASASAAGACSVNAYRVNHTYSGVWHITEPRWLKAKRAGDTVTGPSSNVMDNLRGDWRVVYLPRRRRPRPHPPQLPRLHPLRLTPAVTA